jgi:glyoxylase-like metal-dependent hydrolase (beta-lactamase superfamily II)
MMIRRALSLSCSVVLLLAAAPASADSVTTRKRTVTRVADGVYVIRHPDAPDEFPQSNTTVVIGPRGVLVVDSCYLPSEARRDIAQIRRWTRRPVRWLVNTHWHYDHTMGNGAYAAAFPGLSVIAQRETARHMAGYNPGWFERYPQRTVEYGETLKTGKEPDGTALTAERRKLLTKIMPGRARVAPEFASIVDRLPDVTFDEEMRIDLGGGREVRLLHLGRGNTSGDAILVLPREKIVVAGDLLDHPVPYLGGGYPGQLVATLGRMGEIDFQTLVPGHGDVLRGARARAHLARVSEFVSVVVAEVSKEVYRLGNGPRNHDAVRDAVMKRIDVAGWRQKFAGDDLDSRELFDTFSLPGVITAAYAETWGR